MAELTLRGLREVSPKGSTIPPQFLGLMPDPTFAKIWGVKTQAVAMARQKREIKAYFSGRHAPPSKLKAKPGYREMQPRKFWHVTWTPKLDKIAMQYPVKLAVKMIGVGKTAIYKRRAKLRKKPSRLHPH